MTAVNFATTDFKKYFAGTAKGDLRVNGLKALYRDSMCKAVLIKSHNMSEVFQEAHDPLNSSGYDVFYAFSNL